MKKRLLLLVLIYIIFSICWIFLSDQILLTITNDPAFISRIQSIKGVAFVLITSFMIYTLTYRILSKFIFKNDKLQHDNKEIIEHQNLLLKEMNHRIKNNIGILTNIIDLKKYIYKDDDSQKLLNDLRDKTFLISHIHEKIYTSVDVTEIDLSEYIIEILDSTNDFYNSQVIIKYSIPSVIMNPKHAINVALVLQEIFTNAVKHAYCDICEKKFSVSMEDDGECYHFIIKDNGKGFDMTKLDASESFGMEMIKTIVKQYDGELIFNNDNGGQVNIKIKKT